MDDKWVYLGLTSKIGITSEMTLDATLNPDFSHIESDEGKVDVNPRISVIDTGVGISDENADALFRVGMTHSTRCTANEIGTGLGLILCKEFIEKNNDRIWHEKPGPGSEIRCEAGKNYSDSIFRFILPRVKWRI